MWPPVMVFSWRWLFCSVGIGAFGAGFELARLDGEPGFFAARGIAYALGGWLGYPAGVRLFRLPLRPISWLDGTTLRRLYWLADLYPRPHATADVPFAVRLVTPALHVYVFWFLLSAMAVTTTGFQIVAGVYSGTWYWPVTCMALALLGYAYTLLVSVWLRGRVEVLAYALQRARKSRDVMHRFNRWLRVA